MGAGMIRTTVLGVTTFMFIFGWKINELADLILLTSLALIIYRFFRGHVYADRVGLSVLFCLGLLSIYSILVVMLNGLFDAQIALRSLRALINFIGALSLTSIYFESSNEKFLSNLLRDIYLCLVIHGGIMVAMYIGGAFRAFVYQVTGAADIVNLSSPFLEGLRICGLTYGLSQTSVLQMLGLLLLPVVLGNCHSFSGRLLILAGAPLLVLSMFISGRSGFMIGLCFLPISLGSLSIKRPEGSSPGLSLTSVFINASLLLAIALFVYLAGSLLPHKFSSYSWPQAGEIFSALQLRGPTVTALSDMFFLPGNWLELVFGSSNLGTGSLESIPSDVGWVKTIFASGIIGSLLTLAPYLVALHVSVQAKILNTSMAVTSVLIFSSALLLNFKELALLTRNQWSIHSLLLAALCLQLHQKTHIEPSISERQYGDMRSTRQES